MPIVLRTLLLIAAGLIFHSSVLASSAADLVGELNSKYKGKSAMLRGFYCDSKLEYDAYGNHLHTPTSGPWTVCAYVKFKDFRLKDGAIEIQGRRSGIRFDNGKFVSVNGESMKITLATGENARTDSLDGAMKAIFYDKDQNLTEVVPEYWKCYLANPALKARERKCAPGMQTQTETTGALSKAAASTSAPRLIHDTDPKYTQAAKDAGLRGKVLLRMDVGESGKPENIHIVDPLGLGLDEAAVLAVKNWMFEPARRGGIPLKVTITIEVNFFSGR